MSEDCDKTGKFKNFLRKKNRYTGNQIYFLWVVHEVA